MKKYLSIAIAIVMFVSLFTVSAYATNTKGQPPISERDPLLDDGGIIQILPNRINGDGTFSFNITGSTQSSNFKINSLNYSFIEITAKITNSSGQDVTSSNPNVQLKLTIWKKGTSGDSVFYTYSFYADKTQQYYSIGTSDSTSTFYFKVEVVNGASVLAVGTKVTGSGRLVNCTIL